MTMNEEGVISKITNSNYSKVKSSEDQTDDVYYDEDIRVFKAPGQLKDSIKNFFNELSDKKIKKGDTFTVSFEDSAEKESADSAKKLRLTKLRIPIKKNPKILKQIIKNRITRKQIIPNNS